MEEELRVIPEDDLDRRTVRIGRVLRVLDRHLRTVEKQRKRVERRIDMRTRPLRTRCTRDRCYTRVREKLRDERYACARGCRPRARTIRDGRVENGRARVRITRREYRALVRYIESITFEHEGSPLREAEFLGTIHDHDRTILDEDFGIIAGEIDILDDLTVLGHIRGSRTIWQEDG